LVTLIVLAGIFVAWFLLVLQPYHPGAFYDPLRQSRPIPPIIHQTYKTHQLPEEWQQLQRTWTHSDLALEEGYEYMFWTDEMNRKLIETDFPWFLERYDAYPKPIQRVDAARLFILYKYGGIYVDLDIGLQAGCESTIDSWRSIPVVLPHTTPVGYSNGFMMAAPGHPLIEKMVYALADGDPWWLSLIVPPYFRVLISTGPLFVTRNYLFYDHKDQVLSLSKDDYRNRCLAHGVGSSWHGDDVRLVQFIKRNLFVIGLLLAMFATLVWIGIFPRLPSWSTTSTPSTSTAVAWAKTYPDTIARLQSRKKAHHCV
jgi:inositol phosphorylceramide mannosyltransferase catalytic subunit